MLKWAVMKKKFPKEYVNEIEDMYEWGEYKSEEFV